MCLLCVAAASTVTLFPALKLILRAAQVFPSCRSVHGHREAGGGTGIPILQLSSMGIWSFPEGSICSRRSPHRNDSSCWRQRSLEFCGRWAGAASAAPLELPSVCLCCHHTGEQLWDTNGKTMKLWKIMKKWWNAELGWSHSSEFTQDPGVELCWTHHSGFPSLQSLGLYISLPQNWLPPKPGGFTVHQWKEFCSFASVQKPNVTS